jgi:hypothetical protein
MGQFLGLGSIIVVLDPHQLLDSDHCMLLEVMIRRFLGLVGVFLG